MMGRVETLGFCRPAVRGASRQSIASILLLALLALVATPLCFAPVLTVSATAFAVPSSVSLKTRAVLVGGTKLYDSTGTFSGYTIFAEDYAPISPPPVYRFDIQRQGQTAYNERLITWVAAAPPAGRPTARNLKHRGNNRTETISRSLTAEVTLTPQPTLYSQVRWYIRSKPYGAVDPVGPKTWSSDLSNTVTFANWTFYTPGTYDVLFNATFYDGTSFRFNTSLYVARQPASISNVFQPTGYNGTAWLPNPSGQMLTIIGQPARSATATVRFVIQSQPLGSVVTGTFVKKPDATGLVQFSDIVASIPGSYTYNLEANLTSGAVKTSSSVVVVIERALPVKINILQAIGGIARFNFYDVPLFSMEDVVGPAYDSRINMTLYFSSNNPSHTYDEFDSVAQWCGSGSNIAAPTGYFYVFPNLGIDLAGSYNIEARLSLPDGSTLSRYLSAVIFEPPTWDVFSDSPLAVNQIGVLSLRGDRPRVDPVYFMLSTSADCLVQSSDQIVWTATNDPYLNNVDNARNISVVPFSSGLVYPCLKVPSQNAYGVLIQYYQQQFDEAYPYVTAFTVNGVTQCQQVSASAAAQYRAVGWDTVESGRAYGCALQPPVSGTIAPCDCASHLQCDVMRHRLFTPSNLNIGACVCCATWILALAGTAVSVAFVLLYYTIYSWV